MLALRILTEEHLSQLPSIFLRKTDPSPAAFIPPAAATPSNPANQHKHRPLPPLIIIRAEWLCMFIARLDPGNAYLGVTGPAEELATSSSEIESQGVLSAFASLWIQIYLTPDLLLGFSRYN